MNNNLKVISEDDRIQITGEVCINSKEYIYIASDCYNGLFRIKKEEIYGENTLYDGMEFVGIFPKEKESQRLWIHGETYENYLIFVPLRAENITLFDTVSETFTCYQIKGRRVTSRKIGKYDPNAKFSFCKIIGHVVLFFPYTYPSLIGLNMETLELFYIDSIIDYLSEYINMHGAYFVKTQNFFINEDIIRLWSQAANAVLDFNLRTKKILKITKIDPYYKNIVYDCALCKDDIFLLIPRDSRYPIVKWNYIKGTYTELQIDVLVGKSEYAFCNIVLVQDKIWAFPRMAEGAISIDMKNDNIELLKQLDQYYKSSQVWKTRFAEYVDRNLIICISSPAALVKINLVNSDSFSYSLVCGKVSSYKKNDISKLYKQKKEHSREDIYIESCYFGLKNYIEMIVEGER